MKKIPIMLAAFLASTQLAFGDSEYKIEQSTQPKIQIKETKSLSAELEISPYASLALIVPGTGVSFKRIENNKGYRLDLGCLFDTFSSSLKVYPEISISRLFWCTQNEYYGVGIGTAGPFPIVPIFGATKTEHFFLELGFDCVLAGVLTPAQWYLVLPIPKGKAGIRF